MIRRLALRPTGYDRSYMRTQAFARWPFIVDVNEVDDTAARVAFYFNDADAPAQVDVDLFVSTYDPTPPPTSAEETAFANAKSQLEATFNTARTAAQANNSIDALTVIARRFYRGTT